MINFKSLNTTATVTVGLLVIGALVGSISGSATETIIPQTGTAEHLEGIDSKSGSEWQWQVGGEAPGAAENSETDSEITDSEIKESNALSDSEGVNPSAQSSQEWENQNSGDFKRVGGVVPFVVF